MPLPNTCIYARFQHINIDNIILYFNIEIISIIYSAWIFTLKIDVKIIALILIFENKLSQVRTASRFRRRFSHSNQKFKLAEFYSQFQYLLVA